MKKIDLNISQTINKAKAELAADENISSSLKLAFESLFMLITVLTNMLGLNSTNSHKPPSTDQHSNKKNTLNTKKDRKPGVQKGQKEGTLNQVNNPDVIEQLDLDIRLLPAGDYKQVGIEKR